MKCFVAVAVASVLSICSAGFGAVTYDAGTFTLTYGSPSDLDTIIDPPALKDVQMSFGMTKDAFQALNPQVVGFNAVTQSNPGPDQNLKTLVVTVSTGKSIQFNFPAIKYNYGGKTSQGRSAFSGPAAYCDFSTYETQPTIPGLAPPATGWNAWLDVTIDTTGAAGRKVKALGFCVCSHNVTGFNSGPGTAYFVLSDGTLGTVDYPKFGGDDPTQAIFVGYQAPAGKTITAVYCTRPGPGNSYIAIDDLSFVMTMPSHLVGDINGDGYVNVGDLQLLVASWAGGPGYSGPEDINGDGYVNVGDLQLLVANWGASSVDTTAPAAVTDLATTNPTSNSITLTWTAPGDDGNTGTAASYDIRYRIGGAIDDSNWASATQVISEPTPAAAGTNQSMIVSGLLPNTTYYFAIKTSDEVPNTSAISNSPSGTTSAATNKVLLTPKDFRYKGYYVVQNGGDFQELYWGGGFTHRYVSGQLRFLTLSHIHLGAYPPLVEFAPPGSYGGTVTSKTNWWDNIWAGTGTDYLGWTGLWFEQAQNRLWTTSAVDYPDDTQGAFTKAIAVRTLNSDGTISNAAGPWGLSGIQQRRIYGGVQAVPSWFQSTYGTGPYATGWGGYASRFSAGGGVSLGPTFYAFPEPTGFPAGNDTIPTSAFKTIMDHSAATLGSDWYAQGYPTTLDRGVRNCDVKNDYDTPNWQSPAPDGLGRWTWADSNYNTGCWIETASKQGFILIPKLASGRTWYQTSTLHCERQQAEIQVFDPNMLGQVAQGSRAAWNTYPTYRWQITDDMLPLGLGWGTSGNSTQGGPSGATYDSTTQTLYVYCQGGTGANSYILVYEVGNGNAAVSNVATAETAVTGTVSGYGSGVTGLPGNRACTETADSVYETITEVLTGGTSQLEQKWTFSVTGGSSVTFNVKAYHNSNSDGDDFVFSYSTDGTNWTDMVTVTKTADDGNFQTYTMPANTSGTVYVRVRDADRTAGHNNLDTIYIDKMYFLSNP